MATRKYVWMLEDPEVRRWFENLRRGSLINSDTSLRSLGLLCEKWGCKPSDMLELARQGKLQGMLEDEVAKLEREGKAGSYIKNIIKPVKSWLEYNGLELKRKIKIKGVESTPTLEQERVPTREELVAILRHLDKRGKAMAAMMVFAGLRIECIGSYDGTDGLMMKDLPEMRIEGSKVVFDKVPTIVKVRATISKIRRAYFTFLIEEGCIYLKEYLEWRIARGEKLGPDTPVFGHSAMARKVKRKFLWGTKAGGILRGSEDDMTGIRGAGFPWRPYVLRSYADTAFDIAEAKGLISHPWRQFFMGHKGDIEARYSTNKARLPPDMIEEMRKAYLACQPMLTTVAQPLEQTSLIKEAKLEAIKSIAKSMFGVDLLEIKTAREKEAGKELNQDEQIELFENEMKKRREPQPDPQMTVKEEELETYLKGGWQFVSVLPSQKILIRK